jgi:hypothetical protein
MDDSDGLNCTHETGAVQPEQAAQPALGGSPHDVLACPDHSRRGGHRAVRGDLSNRLGRLSPPHRIIRLLDTLSSVVTETTSDEQRRIVMRQADMIFPMAQQSVSEPNDLEDIRVRYDRMVAADATDK